MIDFKQLPKIELHVHLDGSVRLSTASELLQKPVSQLKEKMIAPITCNSLTDYLKCFDIPISLMQTKENLIRISKELALDLLDDGVVYAEIRFCPLFHTTKGLTKEEVVDAVLEGLRSVPLKTNLILCMMRHFSLEQNKEIINLADKYLKHGVCAIDLAGDEAKFKTEQYQKLFEIARKKGIPYTIHAGEADGIESVKSAISFETKRLGHGIHVIDDMKEAKEIANKNILLEICPTSNIQTKSVLKYQQHPIQKLYELGYSISINTDNRTVSNITLTKEYQLLYQYFHFSVEQFKKINIQTLEHCFVSAEEKKEILKKLDY